MANNFYCLRCRKWKPTYEFGRNAWCDQCEAVRLDVSAKKGSLYTGVYRRAKRNAGVRGIEFNLSLAEFQSLVDIADGTCQISGLVFDFHYKVGPGRRNPFAPSLDRIDSKQGYSVANCRLISIIANMALNEWGERPLHKFCRAVVRHLEVKKAGRKSESATILQPSKGKELQANP